MGFSNPSVLSDIDKLVSEASPKIFTTYAIFDERYRERLNTLILKHYLMNEIGFETVALWKFKLNQKMSEIMPYYNELYKTTLYDIDPFSTMDYTVKHDGSDTKDVLSNLTDVMTELEDVLENIGNTEKDVFVSNEKGTSNRDIVSRKAADINVNDEEHSTGKDEIDGKKTSDTAGESDNTIDQHQSTTYDGEKTTETYNNLKDQKSGTLTHSFNEKNKGGSTRAFSDTPQGTIKNVESKSFLTDFTSEDNETDHTGTNTDTDNTSNTRTGNITRETSGGHDVHTSGDMHEEYSTNIVDSEKTTKTSTNDLTKDTTTTQNEENTTSDDLETTTERKNTDEKKADSERKSNRDKDSRKESDQSTNEKGTNQYLDHYKGRNGITMAEALQKYREALINIDLMVINELRDLFMLIY